MIFTHLSKIGYKGSKKILNYQIFGKKNEEIRLIVPYG